MVNDYEEGSHLRVWSSGPRDFLKLERQSKMVTISEAQALGEPPKLKKKIRKLR